MTTKTHYPEPQTYPDNRGYQLTLCGIRVNIKDGKIDNNDPSCEDCQRLMKKFEESEP